ncbi:epimerase [Chondromyces crocatus]|uniref:Epimerase n=1 Tax=Chondromyces crocatus TaxID=52 RepID=A0A0K1EMN5_CHOCO|nr:epimerase [Chondromyces crocatus]AKT42066.1 epimerase [Chondromyces crocatus]
MNILLFGATGMVGQGVLGVCLGDPDVENVLAVGRNATGQPHPKLRELIHRDFLDLAPIEDQLAGHDACFFCLGTSSLGMSEEDYRRVTYDIALSVGRTLARLSPDLTFVFVSGSGTDGTAKGRVMWARVKGETENALLALPFEAYMFRPAFIHGVRPKQPLFKAIYGGLAPLFPVLQKVLPKYMTTTDHLGRAMLEVARYGAPMRVLENADIDRIGREAAASTHGAPQA